MIEIPDAHDTLFQQQAAELHDESPIYYSLQEYLVGIEDGEWVYRWQTDLSNLFTTREEAETVRVEFYCESRTRILKVEMREVEVVAVFEASTESRRVAGQKLFF